METKSFVIHEVGADSVVATLAARSNRDALMIFRATAGGWITQSRDGGRYVLETANGRTYRAERV